MQVINQDILDIGRGIIAHQCNCQGVMGAGLARAIRNIWPEVYYHYREDYKEGLLKLGAVQVINVVQDLAVANLMSQEFYGRQKGRVYTDYEALRTCLRTLEHRRQNSSNMDATWPIYLPYKIGCGLAGGDWHEVSQIIEEELPHAIICKKQ